MSYLAEQWDEFSLQTQLSTTNLTDDEKDYITNRYFTLNMDNEFEAAEIEELNKWILDSRIDPIQAGWNYGQKDILRNLKRLR